MNPREIILIGLGDFGRTVLTAFEGILADRQFQLPPELRERVVFHPLPFESREAFSFPNLATRINESVAGSRARKIGEGFSYIFVGDLGEHGTALYALDHAFLPWALDQSQSVKKRDVLGFFTFSDELGVNEQHSDEGMALIRNFFTSLTQTALKKEFQPAYLDVNGKGFLPISAPQGPFDRNYVLVTPGNRQAVENETSRVFAERIFYEAFYLSEAYEQLASTVQARKSDSPDHLFSGFSLVQVSRLKQNQEYYLKFNLQSVLLESLLAPPLQGTDLEYFEEKFLEIVDLDPIRPDFPLDRAVELFFRNHIERFRGLLDFRIGRGAGAFRDYLAECRARLEAPVADLRPKYDLFVRQELDHLLSTLDEAMKNLFRIDRLTGNLDTYLKFIELLEARFTGWTADLESLATTEDPDSLDPVFKAAEDKIRKTLSNRVLGFFLFVPIREAILRNHILSLPLEKYVYQLFRKKLAQSFLLAWKDTSANSRHPVQSCRAIKSHLETLRSRLREKLTINHEKQRFIETMNSFYYVITPLGNDEYTQLLKRIYERNLGAARKTELEKTAVNAFKLWTADKDLMGIVADPTGFVSHLDRFTEDTWKHFGEVEENAARTVQFDEEALKEKRARMESLSRKSFRGANLSDSLVRRQCLLRPQLDEFDNLDHKMRTESELFSTDVPKDFTMGSAVFFQDDLHLKYSSLQKYEILEKYAGVTLPRPQYSSSVGTGESSPLAKYVRVVLCDWFTENMRLLLFQNQFAAAPTVMSEADIDRLAQAVDLEKVLGLLDDERLKDFARANDVPVSPNREKLAKLIVKKIRDKVG